MKSRSLRSNLYGAFWGLYGRHAWDDQGEQARVSEPPERLVDIIRKRRHSSRDLVLDAGCGTGNYAHALAGAGFRVVGIDFATGMLARAREKIKPESNGGVSFQQADLNRALEFPDGQFDHAISISVLQAVADPAFTIGELRRVLKPGGTLVLSLPKQNSKVFTQTLGGLIRHRIENLERRTPGKILLVILKTLGDRYGNMVHWTVPQVRQMIKANGFRLISIEEGRQILAVAEKPGAGSPKSGSRRRIGRVGGS